MTRPPSSHRSARFVGMTLAGRYRVDELLREGHFDTLLRAVDVAAGARVAVRVYFPDAAAKINMPVLVSRETAVSARIRHPAVAAATATGVLPDGSTFLVLPDLGGLTLRAAMSDGPMPLPRATAIVRRIGLALETLHAAGIVHCALAPESVHLSGAGPAEQDAVMLADFGFAQLGSGEPGPPLDPSSPAAAYASPDVRAGGIADGQDDFYALSVLFYELVMGKRPGYGNAGLPHAMTSVRSLPAAVDALALHLIADEPDRRARVAVEVVRALDELSDPSASARSSAPSFSPSPSKPGRERVPSAPLILDFPNADPARARSPQPNGETPATAVTGQITTSEQTGAHTSPVGPGGLRNLPPLMQAYVAGTAAITLVVAAAIAVRPTAVLSDLEPSGVPSSKTATPRSTAAVREPSPPPPPAQTVDAERPPDARELRVRLEKSFRIGNTKEFVADLERLIDLDATAADDRDLKNAMIEILMRIMMGESPDADRLFALMEGKMGAAGPDLLYELVTTRGGSRAARRAEEALRDQAVKARGTPALRIAYDLRTARTCDEKRALLQRAGEEGDRRTLGHLQLLSRDCGRRSGECCMGKDPALKAAMEALKDRLR